MATNNKSLASLQNHLATKSGTTSLSLRDRIESQKRQGKDNLLLLDISGSMSETLENNWRKIDALWQIVQDLRAQGLNFRTAEFSDATQWSDSTTCPRPTGGTCLVQALEFLKREASPLQLTIITDGCPWDSREALAFAPSLECIINVLYVGPSDDTKAQGFCIALANACNGKYSHNSMATELLQLEATSVVKGLLAAPESASAKRTINL